MKSLYMKPAKVAKSPISKRRYRAFKICLIEGIFWESLELKTHIIKEVKKRVPPWPISPNIIPNKNGKVIILNTVGLNSL